MYFRERAECGGVAAAPAFAVDQVNARRAWPERLLSRTSIVKLSTLSVEFFFKLLTRSNPQALKFLFDRAYLAVNKRKMTRPTRFERVTFAFGGQTPTNPAVHRRRKLKGWASTWMSHDGFHEKIGSETPAFGVARTVGFGLERSKMRCLSMGID
jgi:hypothetical protein